MSVVVSPKPPRPFPCFRARTCPRLRLMKQRSLPSWGSWPHIAVAHLSEPLTVSTRAGRCPDITNRCFCPVQCFHSTSERDHDCNVQSHLGLRKVPTCFEILRAWVRRPLSKARRHMGPSWAYGWATVRFYTHPYIQITYPQHGRSLHLALEAICFVAC